MEMGMRLVLKYVGGADPFEGDRTLWLRALPNNAQVMSATMQITPRSDPATKAMFVETIRFTDPPTWGATTVAGGGAAEVDFHNRRTLNSVTGAVGAVLLVDFGGTFLEINEHGAIKGPTDNPYV